MGPLLEPPRVHVSGLIQLQNALNELEDVADAFLEWTGNPDVSPIEVLVDRGSDGSRQVEMIEGLAELLREQSVLAPEASGSRLARRSPREPLVGSTIDADRRFEYVRHHAEGGLGTVSVAIDHELNREVALKQILERHADDLDRRDRFLVEAEITGRLEHPGIVPVYSLGHSCDGRPFYAMRLIRGETMAHALDHFHADESLQRDPGAWGLQLRLLLRRFIDVCHAIEYAHGRGILHRDLKPSNVMLGKHGETLVLDWGLAKPIGASDPEADEEGLILPSADPGATLPGSAVGTPSFMSPEQAAGRDGVIGPRSDVYSLGATLYCLLTGRPPFESEPGKILQDVRDGRFPRPCQANPLVPRPLEAICLKAMALDPEARYGSPKELVDDIERWKADEPISALLEPLHLRFGRWMRRRRTVVSATLAALMVATVALGIVLAIQSKANHDLRRANEVAHRINRALLDANRRVAKTNQELEAGGIRERARFDLALDAIRIFHSAVSDDLILRGSEFARLRSRLLGGAIEFYRKLERQFADQPERTSREAIARIYGRIADLEATLGTGPEVLAAYHKALELRRSLAGDSATDLDARAEVASTLISLGIMARKLETLPASLNSLEEARTILVELHEVAPKVPKFQLLLAQSEREIGVVLNRLKKYQEALAAYDRARRIQQELALAEPSSFALKDDLATLTNDKGVLELRMGQYQEAQQTLGQAREILEQLLQADPGNPHFQQQLGTVLKDLGDLSGRSGKFVESLELHSRALTIRESLSAALPSSAIYRQAISYSLLAIGQLHHRADLKRQAIAAYQRSVALQETGFTSPIALYNLAFTRTHLADCLEGADSLAEADRAAQAFRQAISAGYGDFAAIRSIAHSRSKVKSSPEFRLLLLDIDFPSSPFPAPQADNSRLTHR